MCWVWHSLGLPKRARQSYTTTNISYTTNKLNTCTFLTVLLARLRGHLMWLMCYCEVFSVYQGECHHLRPFCRNSLAEARGRFVHQDSSKGGAVETGFGGSHYVIGCFIIWYYPRPLHPPPTAPPFAEYQIMIIVIVYYCLLLLLLIIIIV